MAVVTVDGSPAEEIADIGRLRQLFQQARDQRKPRTETWQRSYEMLYGRQWSSLRASWLPSPQASEIYPIVAAMVGWMTDQRPIFTVTPAASIHSPIGQQMAMLASDMEKVLHAVWYEHHWDAEIEKILWDAMIYGTGFLKVTWDMALDGGLGNVALKRVDPFHFYPDPQATSLDDANYIIEARTMSLQELDRRFPGAASKISSDQIDRLEERNDIYRASRVQRANPAAITGGLNVFGQVTQQGTNRWGQPGAAGEHVAFDYGVTVYECWLREHEHWEDDDGEPHVDDHWVVYVVAGDQILMREKATDLWSHGRHPYTRYVLQDIGEFWGMSLVEHLTPLQLSINRLLAALQSHAELCGNPVLIEDSRSGVQRTTIVNKPGQRITKNAGAEFDWMRPPDMPASVSDLVRFYLAEMERVSGLSAIVRGMTPSGRNAQGVIDSVQEAGFVRVRLALRSLERTMREAGDLSINLIVENYTLPRVIGVTGGTGERFSIVLRKNHFYWPTQEGEIPLRFTLWVNAGSQQPISRQQRAAEADMLYAMGAIDRIALLEAHDYPDRHQIADRIGKLEAAGMFNPPGARQRARRTT